LVGIYPDDPLVAIRAFADPTPSPAARPHAGQDADLGEPSWSGSDACGHLADAHGHCRQA